MEETKPQWMEEHEAVDNARFGNIETKLDHLIDIVGEMAKDNKSLNEKVDPIIDAWSAAMGFGTVTKYIAGVVLALLTIAVSYKQFKSS